MGSLPNSIQNPITGIVVPDCWDDHGQVVGVSIQAYDECEYAVGQNAWTKRLIGLTQKKIRAWGQISQLPAGKFWIQVDKVEVIEQ